jgi:hypothetical protein
VPAIATMTTEANAIFEQAIENRYISSLHMPAQPMRCARAVNKFRKFR